MITVFALWVLLFIAMTYSAHIAPYFGRSDHEAFFKELCVAFFVLDLFCIAMAIVIAIYIHILSKRLDWASKRAASTRVPHTGSSRARKISSIV
jgi:Na+-driven multidrug efflux pump